MADRSEQWRAKLSLQIRDQRGRTMKKLMMATALISGLGTAQFAIAQQPMPPGQMMTYGAGIMSCGRRVNARAQSQGGVDSFDAGMMMSWCPGLLREPLKKLLIVTLRPTSLVLR